MTDPIELYCHPDYLRQERRLTMYFDLYQGDHDVLTRGDTYIPFHEYERNKKNGAAFRKARMARTRVLNLVEPVVSVWTSVIFGEEPVMDQETLDLYGDAIKNVDGRGSSLLTFLRDELAVCRFRDGRVAVLTDAYPFAGQTLADQVDLRAFHQILPALAVKDWQLSDTGSYRMVRWEYQAVEPRESLTQEPAENTYSRVLALTASGVESRRFKLAQGGRWEEAGPAAVIKNFTELPVAAVPFGESWVKDVCEQQIEVLNHTSNLNNQLHAQGYDRTVFIGDVGQETERAWHEFSGVVVPPGTQVQNLPAADVSNLRQRLLDCKGDLFKVAFNRIAGLAEDSKVGQAVETLREQKDEMIRLVVSQVEEFENVANKMARDWAVYVGNTAFNGRVTFNRDISTEDIEKVIDLYAVFKQDIDKNLPAKKGLMKKVIARFDLPEELEEEALAEVDKMELPKPVDPTLGLKAAAAAFGAQKQSQQQVVNGDGAGAGDPPK